MKNFKRIISLMLVVVLCMTSFSACKKEESKEDSKDDSLEYVMDKGKLILGLDDAFPPMGFRNDKDEITGFDVELAKEVAKRMGVELVLQPIAWDSKDFELKQKNIDCIWNGFGITDEREEAYTITDAYLGNPQIVVVPAGSDIKTKEDLAGKTVAVQSGSTSEACLNKDEALTSTFKELIPVENNVTAMLELDTSSADAVVMDTVVAQYYMSLNKDKYRILDGLVIFDEKMGVAFRKGDQALCDKVWDTLKEMKKDGTLKKISEQWFGEDLTLVD